VTDRPPAWIAELRVGDRIRYFVDSLFRPEVVVEGKVLDVGPLEDMPERAGWRRWAVVEGQTAALELYSGEHCEVTR